MVICLFRLVMVRSVWLPPNSPSSVHGTSSSLSTCSSLVLKEYMSSLSFSRFASPASILLSSIGFFGFLMSVTSKRPSSSSTSAPYMPLKPPTERELVTIPYINSSSIISPSWLTFILYEVISIRCFAPSKIYAACPSIFFICCEVW